MSDKNDPFDRRFVLRAITLVVISLVAVMLLRAIAGDSAAQVGMLGLAAVLAKIFEKSETLQIQLQPETPPAVITLTALEPWRLTVVASCFMGVTLVLGDISDWLVVEAVPPPPNVHPHFTPLGLSIAVALMGTGYYFAGYIATRSLVAVRFAYVLWAAVIDLFLTHWAYTVIQSFARRSSNSPITVSYEFTLTWVLYVTFALIGARVGMKNATHKSNTHPSDNSHDVLPPGQAMTTTRPSGGRPG